MNRFVVVAMNANKVGYYIFNRFKDGKPTFRANHMQDSACHIYLNWSCAAQAAHRLRKFYKNKFADNIDVRVVRLENWVFDGDYNQMKMVFEQ